jgi:8-oxo-dGTP diphosphatase
MAQRALGTRPSGALAGSHAREAASIFVVRHAEAGNRTTWQGEDRLRPLTQTGLHQAAELAKRLSRYHPRRLLSSPHVRCVQTLQPLASALPVTIEIEERAELAEGHPRQAVELFHSLLDVPAVGTVLCTHGDIVDALLSLLGEEYRLDLGPTPRAQKGSTWQIRVEDARPVAATYLAPTSES